MEGMELTWACKIEDYLGEHNGESQAEESRKSGQPEFLVLSSEFLVLNKFLQRRIRAIWHLA